MVDSRIRDLLERVFFKGEIKYDELMSAHTSLRIGGRAEILAFPEDILSLKNLLNAAKKGGLPVFTFGGGSNLLVGDGGIDGIVVSLKAFNRIEMTRDTDDSRAVLYAGAGVPLSALINYAQKNGYAGIEALTGIPGCLGGAVYMNAGSFGVEMKDVIVSVALMNKDGEITILKKDRLNFTYRKSTLPEDAMIISANIELKLGQPDEILMRMKEFLQKKRDTQPLGAPSAGCVFKNPPGDAAGRLIDAAGCKGLRKGDVEVSTIHANYFINQGKAISRDFIELMETVMMRVRESSGVVLEPEIKIVGRL